LGGATGRELAKGLRAERIRFIRFPISGSNRCNVVVSPRTGSQFRFNATWPRLPRSESQGLKALAFDWVRRSDPVVISGTLAFGCPAGTYADIAREARRVGTRLFLDCDREPFARAARQQPFLVKPNEFELAQWAGRPLPKDGDVLQAADELSTLTRNWVLVSRGERGGLLLNSGLRYAVEAMPPKVSIRNTVGAGDALLAAVIAESSRSHDPVEWLVAGVAAGTAATQVEPGRLPCQSDGAKMKARIRVQPVRA
jgi:1-phosphofructokinase family hexose kinase